VDAQLKAGELLLAGKRYEDAKARADQALARDPKHVEAQILRANALAGLNKLDDAGCEVEEAIKREPDRSASYSNLGALQMIRGNRDEAEAAFKQAVATDPKSAARLPGARQLLLGGRPAGRGGGAAEIGARGGARKTILVNRALAYFYMGTGRAAEAEDPLKTFAAVASDSTGKLMLADYYLTVRRVADASGRSRPCPDRSPELPQRPVEACGARCAVGRSSERLHAGQRSIGKEPSSVDGLIVKAQLLVTEGKFDEAQAAVRQAIANDPRSAQAQFALGRLLVARHDAEGAMTAFNEALKLNPSLAEVEMELAKLHLDAGHIDQAQQFARSAATKISGYAEAQIVLAHIDLLQGRLDSAERTLNGLVKALPGAPVVQTEVGRLQLAKGNRAEARAAFERALSSNPNFVDALSALTQMDMQDKHPDVARARVDAAVKRNGTDTRTAELAGETYVALGDYAKAEPVLRQASRRIRET
jgi:tetratricopeptide (TPR) repeat protein